MNIKEAHDFLKFWINKTSGAYYTPAELDAIIDRGQMLLYAELQPKYGTSQRIKDALAPFRDKYDFAAGTSANGLVTVPASRNYLNLLDCSIYYTPSGASSPKYEAVTMVNEDQKSPRLNSQIDPVEVTTPVGEITGIGRIQLWPKVTYTGVVTFLRRPKKPVYNYFLISGRIQVYDPVNSVELEWNEPEIHELLARALSSIGVNISSVDVVNWAELQKQGKA